MVPKIQIKALLGADFLSGTIAESIILKIAIIQNLTMRNITLKF